MAKKIFLLFITVMLFALGFAAIESNAASEMDSAVYVKGGGNKVVKNMSDLLECFEDEEGICHAHTNPDEPNKLILDDNVVLTSSIVIKGGMYTIDGWGLTIFRGFEGGSMIGVDGTEEPAALYLGDALEQGEEWNGTDPNLTIDGNSGQFQNNSVGCIAVRGQVTVSLSGKVVIKNSKAQIGAAIHAECYELEGAENTVLSPSIFAFDSVISGCNTSEGGAIYLYGINGAGSVELERVAFKNNRAVSSALSGLGSCLRADGGEVEINECTFGTDSGNDFNEANYGGAIYAAAKCKITSSIFYYNKATEEGGAIYGASTDEFGECDIELVAVDLAYNSVSGKGGAISNYGKLKISGISFVRDSKATGLGGGIYNEGSLTIEEINLMGNTSDSVGGGIFSDGNNSSFVMIGGEIKSNKAKFVGALYCGGAMKMTGGGISRNKGEFPQILLKQDSEIAKDAYIMDDVIGLCGTEQSNGAVFYPYIKVSEKLRDGVVINVALCSEETDSKGKITGYDSETYDGCRIFECGADIMKTTVKHFNVESDGLFSYELDENGVVAVRFIYLPIWAWIIILIVIAAAVCFIMRKKIYALIMKLRGRFKKTKTPIVHHKKR